jgi:hypothetical protein
MNPIRVALYSLLEDDEELTSLAAGGIHHRRAPQGSSFPLLIFDRQANTAQWSMRSAIDNDLWLVKGVSRGGDSEEAEAIAARVEELLTDAALDVEGRDTLYLRRVSGVSYGEEESGESYHHEGASYRLVTNPSA